MAPFTSVTMLMYSGSMLFSITLQTASATPLSTAAVVMAQTVEPVQVYTPLPKSGMGMMMASSPRASTCWVYIQWPVRDSALSLRP